MLSTLFLLLAAQAGPVAADAAPEALSPSAGVASSPDRPAKPRTEVERLRAEVETLQSEIRRQTMVADNARQQADQMRQDMATKDELLVLGRTRNAELYATAHEILERYRKKDFGAVFKGSEPFVQTSRVKLENLVQDYEDKLRAARVTETTLAPSVEARMQADLDARRAGRQSATDPASANNGASPQN